MVPRQLDLFGSPTTQPAPARGGVLPIEVSDDLRGLALALSPLIRLGTSSWSFPGWANLVYGQAATAERLARHGLKAYAQHPLLRSVGVDRTYYAPIPATAFSEYAAQVSDDFRFVVKAHEVCTLARFPPHARYGAQRGEPNPLFLNADYAAVEVIGPAVEGLGQHLGPILFQFAPQNEAGFGGAARFAEALYRFLEALPHGPVYGVELRNRGLLTAAYSQALVSTGASHCLNVHPTMPEIPKQMARLEAPASATNDARPLLIRWMLNRQHAYEKAKAEYAPFDQIVDADPVTRRQVAAACLAAAGRKRETFVIINNKAEGSAPLSVIDLAREIRRLGAA